MKRNPRAATCVYGLSNHEEVLDTLPFSQTVCDNFGSSMQVACRHASAGTVIEVGIVPTGRAANC